MSIGLAAIEAVTSLPKDQRLLYSRVIEAALSDAARKVLHMYPLADKFLTDAHRQSFDQGKAEGKVEGRAEGKVEGRAEGKAESVLVILRRRKARRPVGRQGAWRVSRQERALHHIIYVRGLLIPDAQFNRIMRCSDHGLLDKWIEAASLVTSTEEMTAAIDRELDVSE